MTTFIPSITIPHSVFASPAASTLLPLVLGSGIGWSTRRQCFTAPSSLLLLLSFEA